MTWQHGTALVAIPKHLARRWIQDTVRYVEISVHGDTVTIAPLRGPEFIEPHQHEGGGQRSDGLS